VTDTVAVLLVAVFSLLEKPMVTSELITLKLVKNYGSSKLELELMLLVLYMN